MLCMTLKAIMSGRPPTVDREKAQSREFQPVKVVIRMPEELGRALARRVRSERAVGGGGLDERARLELPYALEVEANTKFGFPNSVQSSSRLSVPVRFTS